MKALKNIRIGNRLLIGFGCVLILMITSMFVTLNKVAKMNDATIMIAENRYPKIEKAMSLRGSVSLIAISLRNILLSEDKQDQTSQMNTITDIRKKNQEIYDNLIPTVKKPIPKAALEKSYALEKTYIEGQNKLVALVNEGKSDEAKMFLNHTLRPLLEQYRAVLTELIDAQKQLMDESVAESKATYALTFKLSIGMTAVALVLSVFIALYITRSITRPLQTAVAMADTVAHGDLTNVVEVNSQDETGKLLQSLQAMNDSLKTTVFNVRKSTDIISTASSEIAAGTLDLSARTEQQASALEETAASLEELTSTVKQNADNANIADELAKSATAVATKGGDVVQQVVTTMGSINNSSKRVADIITVIDGIAFQTNILALNAAVEAARAGEQGRGFAVVATEVRSLAQRSAAAAKEIKVLIDASVSEVDNGTKLVAQAGDTMKDIVQSIERVSSIISEISVASREQRSGIEQINTAVMQMDGVTQQNAALVEEASAAAASMDSESKGLTQAVAKFKVSTQ